MGQPQFWFPRRTRHTFLRWSCLPQCFCVTQRISVKDMAGMLPLLDWGNKNYPCLKEPLVLVNLYGHRTVTPLQNVITQIYIFWLVSTNRINGIVYACFLNHILRIILQAGLPFVVVFVLAKTTADTAKY